MSGEESFGATQAGILRTTVREVFVPGAGHWPTEENLGFTHSIGPGFPKGRFRRRPPSTRDPSKKEKDRSREIFRVGSSSSGQKTVQSLLRQSRNASNQSLDLARAGKVGVLYRKLGGPSRDHTPFGSSPKHFHDHPRVAISFHHRSGLWSAAKRVSAAAHDWPVPFGASRTN